ncbi:coiled-coil domain-containing protein [Spirochaetota bacterium]
MAKNNQKVSGNSVKKSNIVTRFLRLKAILPFAVIIGLIAVFYILFLDAILKSKLESFATKKNKALVSIDKLHFGVFSLDFSMNALEWTDNKDFMKNLFEIGEMSCKIARSPILEKKVFIEEMKITGLNFATMREKSGKVWISEEAAAGEGGLGGAAAGEGEAAGETSGIDLSQLSSINPKEALAGTEIGFGDDIDALNKEIDAKNAKWDARIKGASDLSKFQGSYDKYKDFDVSKYKSLDQITEMQKEISELKSVKSDMEKKQQEYASMKGDLNKDISSVKSKYAAIQKKKAAELKNIFNNFGIKSFDVGSIAAVVFGDAPVNQVKGYYDGYKMLMSYIPKTEGEEDPSKDSEDEDGEEEEEGGLNGRNVYFPKEKDYPGFWLRKAALSGAYKGMALTGEVNDVSSEPMKTQKYPLTFNLKGRSAKTSTKMLVDGKLEAVAKNKKRNRIVVNMSDIDLKELNLIKENEYIKGVRKGTGALKAELTDVNNVTKITIDFVGRNVGFDLKKIKNKVLSDVLNDTLRNMSVLTIKITYVISGKKSQTYFKTNVDKILSDKLNKYFKKQVDQAKAKVTAEYNKKVQDKLGPLSKKVGMNSVLSKYGSGEKSISDYKSMFESREQLLENKKKEIKDIAKQKAEEAKNKAVDEVQKKVPIKKPKIGF